MIIQSFQYGIFFSFKITPIYIVIFLYSKAMPMQHRHGFRINYLNLAVLGAPFLRNNFS